MKSVSALAPPFVSVRALVIEDHPLYRDALATLLGGVLGNANVVAAGSAEEALRIPEHVDGFQLILLDVKLPGLSGAEAVSALHGRHPEALLFVVSASEDRRDVDAAFRAGARLFISKAVAADALVDIALQALNGRLPGPPAWIGSAGDTSFLVDTVPALTPRQREVLLLLSNGCSNKEISLRTGITESTVKMHVSAIFKVLGVANRTQAILAARRSSLCEAPAVARRRTVE